MGGFLPLTAQGAQAAEEKKSLEGESRGKRKEGRMLLESVGPGWDGVVGGSWEGRELFTGTIDQQGLRI